MGKPASPFVAPVLLFVAVQIAVLNGTPRCLTAGCDSALAVSTNGAPGRTRTCT